MNKQKTIEGWAGQLNYQDEETFDMTRMMMDFQTKHIKLQDKVINEYQRKNCSYYPIIIVALMLLVGIVLLVS